MLNVSMPANICKAIPAYLDVYWEKVHHIFPIVHRRTFEAAGEHIDVLRCAMAAVATQYFLKWDVPVMQAILLCEFFARFRGRRAAIRPSKEFESVYSGVSDTAAIFAPIPQTGPNTVRWHNWLEMESRRRILAACFVLDVHSSAYLDQQRLRTFDIATDGMPHIPLIGLTNDLWEAASPDTWATMVTSRGSISGEQTLLSLVDLDTLSATSIDTYVPFDRAIILAFEAVMLSNQVEPAKVDSYRETSEPKMFRMANIFPECPTANTYLALHHTPLHDLLAVSGDSWIFSQKVLQPKSFAEHQKRLKEWSDSGNAAVAVVFACRALRAFTEYGNYAEDSDDEDDDMDAWEMGRPRMWKDDISDYWGMYVCALICWAYGDRTGRGEESGGEGSGGDDSAALRWVRTVASMRTGDVLGLRSTKDAALVVALVKRWLDEDCIGGRSRLYVDAVGVLKKLEEGVA
ncbi:Zinc finger protein klf1-like protein 3 [Colletotrichum chlorophyti]|uniref:Zinc finger protein klf1-like protein 3 n=1 Tax=Colletotrichum chlorophyti TaxID=708187 RepID=A0A1Q8RQP1_9PEZI|nr:Zinc finger protein klf1-like protein 3 [Colletotrichum chlorophyti]